MLAEDGSAPALLDRESVVSGSLPEDTAQALRTPGFSMAAGYISLPLPIGQRALLFGAGHISQALCPLLNTCLLYTSPVVHVCPGVPPVPG